MAMDEALTERKLTILKAIIKTYLETGEPVLLGAMLSLQGQAQDKQMQFQNTIKVEAGDSHADIIAKAAHVVPSPNQLAALQNEFIAFIHFGPNSFTRLEWGSGKEDPKVFDLKELDTDQWCEAMKAAS